MPIPDYLLLAKQPMFNAELGVIAHELLFRNPMNLSAADIGGDIATHQVLLNYCSSVFDQAESSSLPVFINVDPVFICTQASLPVEPSRVVVELRLNEPTDNALLASLQVWKSAGFRFSLENYDFSPRYDAFLAQMDFLKVDVLSLERNTIISGKHAHQHLNAQWIATHIEDEETFEHCKTLAFAGYQGYFLARPREIKGNSIKPGTATTLRIIQELDRPNISMDEITRLVSQDPKLALQMLKIINSSLFTLPRVIEDLKTAIVYLGAEKLKQWAMIIAFLSNGETHLEACRFALHRAKACELNIQANSNAVALASTAFLAGLVSGTQILFRIAPATFLNNVRLSPVVEQAVLNHEGPIGEALREICDLEYALSQGDLSIANSHVELAQCYWQAGNWADEVIDNLKR